MRQEAVELAYEEKEIAKYVKQQQALDREDRTAWRNLRMAEMKEKKRVDEIQMMRMLSVRKTHGLLSWVHYLQDKPLTYIPGCLMEMLTTTTSQRRHSKPGTIFTEYGYRKRFREVKLETEEMPDMFVICLKNYLGKWLELSGSSSGNFDNLVDLIVKEQFINASSEEWAVYLLERGPKDLVELTTYAHQYLMAHKQQLGGKDMYTVQPKRAEQRKPTQSKLDVTQGRQRLLQCYRCQGYGHRQSECLTKVSPSKDQKSSTPAGQSNQKKTRAMVAKSHVDGEEAFTCVNMERPRSSGNSKKSSLNGLASNDEAIYSAACSAQSNDGQI